MADRATRRIDPGPQAADLSQENKNVNQGPKGRGNNSKADRETATPDSIWQIEKKKKPSSFQD
jgi:hypothetical protein